MDGVSQLTPTWLLLASLFELRERASGRKVALMRRLFLGTAFRPWPLNAEKFVGDL
jgi:hypothetical protein